MLGLLLIFREPRQPDLLRHVVLFWVVVSGGMELYFSFEHGEVLTLLPSLLFHGCLGALVSLELTPSEAMAVGVAGGASLLFTLMSLPPLPAS